MPSKNQGKITKDIPYITEISKGGERKTAGGIFEVVKYC